MIHRRKIVGSALLAACMALATGCTQFVSESARSSVADFFSTVLSEAVNTVFLPGN